MTQAELAREEGVTAARVSQLLALTKLAPEVQEMILEADPEGLGVRTVTARRLLAMVGLPASVQTAKVEEALTPFGAGPRAEVG